MKTVKVLLTLMILCYGQLSLAVTKPNNEPVKPGSRTSFVESEAAMRATSFYRLKQMKKVMNAVAIQQDEEVGINLSRKR